MDVLSSSSPETCHGHFGRICDGLFSFFLCYDSTYRRTPRYCVVFSVFGVRHVRSFPFPRAPATKRRVTRVITRRLFGLLGPAARHRTTESRGQSSRRAGGADLSRARRILAKSCTPRTFGYSRENTAAAAAAARNIARAYV